EILGRKSVAESDLEMRKDRYSFSQRMFKKNYVTASQVQSDQSLLNSAVIALDKVIEELRVLEQFTKPRQGTDLKSKVAEAERALDRVNKQAVAKEVTARTDRETKRLIHEKELTRYRDIEDEIRKCTILAPQDGLVVYYIPEQSRGGMGAQQSIVAQGE